MRKILLTYLVGGEAGMGIARSGRIFAKTFVRGGYYVFGMIDYPSLIRGGHNFYLATVGEDRVWTCYYETDLMIALNFDTIQKHANHITEKSGIIFDENTPITGDVKNKIEEKDAILFKVPLTTIVKELNAPLVARNMVALGSAIAILDYDPQLLYQVIRKEFGHRPKVAEINVKVAEKGYEWALKEYGKSFKVKIKPRKDNGGLYMTGDEAVAVGALRAGLKTYYAYPMTPASPILHFLAQVEKDYDIVVLQPENEIAAINMAIGSWYAGARSMVATSGGGFSLMVEALGQAAMTEIPVVVVNVQRVGPSTGQPTYTAQSDLRFMIHASQGEFPRFVIAPGDVEEAFYFTVKAFNLAEKYQVPAIILLDKHLGESHATVTPFDLNKAKVVRGKIITGEYKGDDYKRYEITETGVSPMALPGTLNAIVKCNSSEHDEHGYATSSEKYSKLMTEKRFRKLKYMLEEIEKDRESVKVYGDVNSRNVVITWGSTKCSVLESLRILEERGISIKVIQPVILQPFPENRLRRELEGADKIIDVEVNYTGQLASLLREYLLLKPDHLILKYNGRPFYPVELAEKLMEVL